MRPVGPRLSRMQDTGTKPGAQSNQVCFSWILLKAKQTTSVPQVPKDFLQGNSVWKRKSVSHSRTLRVWTIRVRQRHRPITMPSQLTNRRHWSRGALNESVVHRQPYGQDE